MVKRYEPEVFGGPLPFAEMEEDPNGDWVSYADYEALREQAAKSLEAWKRFKKTDDELIEAYRRELAMLSDKLRRWSGEVWEIGHGVDDDEWRDLLMRLWKEMKASANNLNTEDNE